MNETKKKSRGCLRSVIAVIAVLGTIGVVVSIQSKNYKPQTQDENLAMPYSYKEVSREDLSYGATRRLIVRIRLDTLKLPERARMVSTAKQVSSKQSSKWKEVTVFMIYGKMQDFNFGAYAVGEFNSSGLVEFKTHTENYQLWEKRNAGSK